MLRTGPALPCFRQGAKKLAAHCAASFPNFIGFYLCLASAGRPYARWRRRLEPLRPQYGAEGSVPGAPRESGPNKLSPPPPAAAPQW